MNAAQVTADVLAVIGDALKAEGVEGELAAAVLDAIATRFLGSATPHPAATLAGAILGKLVPALGGADQIKAILDAEYSAARAAADAAAKAVAGG